MKKKIKQILENIIYVLFTTNESKILNKIKNNNNISFDIFDTLIKRNVITPDEVFKLIEIEYNQHNDKIKNFSKIRKQAYYKAKKKLQI